MSKEKKAEACYTNRELSWLQFNERVLEEAGNPLVPLAERLTFASIYQSNLDEFFMVRVGTLMMQRSEGLKIRENKTNMSSKQQINEILHRVKELEQKKSVIYTQLMGELEPQGVRIIDFGKLSNKEAKLLEGYFDQRVAPFLTPMIVGRQQPVPFLENKKLYAIVLLSTGKGKPKLGIVPCSNSVFTRLIEVPTRPGCFVLSEELILHFVSKLYPKFVIREKSIMRITRNADIDASDIFDEDMDYRNMMNELIKQRKKLNPVRVELSRSINEDAQEELSELFQVSKKQVIVVSTPLDLSYVFKIQDYLHNKMHTDRTEAEKAPELFYLPRSPQSCTKLDMHRSILDQIEEKDVMLEYPFQSMKPFIKMLNDAADDPTVVSVKMTLYRVANRSKIIEALVDAAENGKEVVVLVELRARFDEENNILMSRRLEEAGCKILYGLGSYKVHSKLCQITRMKNDSIEYITQVGTGNYNEKTSTLYTDLSLMTTNQEIGAEVASVFRALQEGETVDEVKYLLVAPNCLQNRILDMIQEQIDIQQNGGHGYVGAKINSLTDKDILDKLVEASKAGVSIELIIRGICCLKPGIEGHTDNIKVVSVVGRFLEHSRIYRFGRGENEKLYIASADFMTRNTLKRVEVACPIYDEAIRNRVRYIFDTVLNDGVKGWIQQPDGIYVHNAEGAQVNSQELFYQEAYDAVANAKHVEVPTEEPEEQVSHEEAAKLMSAALAVEASQDAAAEAPDDNYGADAREAAAEAEEVPAEEAEAVVEPVTEESVAEAPVEEAPEPAEEAAPEPAKKAVPPEEGFPIQGLSKKRK